ncbi:MAG: flavodoxin family protein [Anaerolineae bacterium]
MRVLACHGSPRIGGNTELMVAEILRGAREAGAEVELVALNKLAISPCQACRACHKTGRCRIQDDMQPLYDKILEADALVIGTPIYFWGPSAQLKAFIDRWFALDLDGVRDRLVGKPVQLVCAHADEEPETAAATVLMMRTGFDYLQMPFREPLLGVASERGEIARNTAVMQRAYAAGVALVG